VKKIAEMTQGELAAHIDNHLKKRGIAVVLSGGAAVAIYSNHSYVSKDIDFVARFSLDNAAVASAMKEIGFEREDKYYFHPETDYFVDFVAGPPSIGNEPIGEIRELQMDTGAVRIISPTDSVKDRLAAYFHWEDRQCLDQALLVASTNKIDLDQVEAWSIREGEQAKFEEFMRRL
jgi:hypothetical protein